MNLPSDLKEKLSINPEELKTYPEIKKKLLEIKKFYENKFDFDVSKDMPMSSLYQTAIKKIHFDQMWIAVSNMDLASVRTRPVSPGTIRAQAFF